MQVKRCLSKLERHYPQYLKDLVNGHAFTPIRPLSAGEKPDSYLALNEAFERFRQYEKKTGINGWILELEAEKKNSAIQRWIQRVRVESEEDFLALIKKKKEAARFQEHLQMLLEWNPAISTWLEKRTSKVLELQAVWKGICAVVDYLLTHPVQNHYLRSLPISVHTKFIEQYEGTIFSLIRHLHPELCKAGAKDLETALGLRIKPFLFPLRWLDTGLQQSVLPDFEVLGVTEEFLRTQNWPVKEIWLVENETTLYMLPAKANALAICVEGKALARLNDIPLLQHSHLYYWGDMDEEGYNMLSKFWAMYPHTQSIFMDEACFLFHQSEAEKLPKPYKKQVPAHLTETELAAFNALKQINGRIEQEKLQLAYVQEGMGMD